MMQRVDGVVLAAGLASRMAAAKLELDIDGIPVITRVVKAALDSRLHRVILVVGPSPESLLLTLGDLAVHPRVTVTGNPHPERGMSGSLGVGISALEPDTGGAMILLGDQPLIRAGIIDRLLAAFHEDPEKIVAPLVHGRRTNPVVFPAALFSELRGVRGDIGGRDVVKRNPQRVVGIDVSDEYDDTDLDTPADLHRMRERVMLMKRREP